MTFTAQSPTEMEREEQFNTSGEVQQSQLSKGNGAATSQLQRRLMLLAIFVGNETINAYQQQYEVFLLQILGVPVTFVSIWPLITGPTSMLLLNLLGQFSDRGSNPCQRKMAAVVITSAITVCGIVLLVTANVIFLSEDSSKPTSLTYNDSWLHANVTYGMDKVQSQNTWSLDIATQGSLLTDTGINSSVPLKPVDTESSQLALPIKTILGVCGVILIDISCDLSAGTSRSCVLACSLKQDHVSLLVLSLVMSSAGGIFENILGIIDLTQLCPSVHGDRMIIQTTLQILICCIVNIPCLASTVITAHLNTKHLNSTHFTRSDHKEQNDYGTFLSEDDREEKMADAGYSDYTASGCQETDLTVDTKRLVPAQPAACRALTVSGHHQPHADLRHAADINDSIISSEAVLESSAVCSPVDEPALGLPEDLKKYRFNFVIACMTYYFGSSIGYSYNLYAPDFLSKEVFNGNSSAPQGSSGHEAYEEGISTAATGLLLFYCSYLAFSAVHDRLIKLWGSKVDFCLAHVLIASTALCFTLSHEVAFYYITNALYGFQRSAVLTQPFLVANEYVHQQKKHLGGNSSVGKTVAILACMLPLNYCTLYVLSGPLISLTHYNGMPLLVGAGAAYLAAVMSFMYKS